MPVRRAGLVCPLSQVEGNRTQGLAAEAAALRVLSTATSKYGLFREILRKDWPSRRPRFAHFLLLFLSMDFSAKYYARTGRPGDGAARPSCHYL